MKPQRTSVQNERPVSAQSLDHSWPQELREWWEAAQAADTTYLALDALEGRAHSLDASLPRHAASLNELRELAALAYTIRRRIDTAAAAVLAEWDSDTCSWRPRPRDREEGPVW